MTTKLKPSRRNRRTLLTTNSKHALNLNDFTSLIKVLRKIAELNDRKINITMDHYTLSFTITNNEGEELFKQIFSVENPGADNKFTIDERLTFYESLFERIFKIFIFNCEEE